MQLEMHDLGGGKCYGEYTSGDRVRKYEGVVI